MMCCNVSIYMLLILKLLRGTSGLHNPAFSQNVPVPLIDEAAEKATGQHPKIRHVSLPEVLSLMGLGACLSFQGISTSFLNFQ